MTTTPEPTCYSCETTDPWWEITHTGSLALLPDVLFACPDHLGDVLAAVGVESAGTATITATPR